MIKPLSDLTHDQLARFEKKVNKTKSCWLWAGQLDTAGYGRVKLGGKPMLAHRVALFLADGNPPEGKPYALHSCRHRHCVNPEHLRWGDHQENMADKKRDGSHQNQWGESNPHTKLTDKQALEIYRRAHAGERTKDLAKEFGVSATVISNIKHGWCWTHITKAAA